MKKNLEFAEERILSIIRAASSSQQPFGQMSLVILLKHILVFEISEQLHTVVEQSIELVFRHLSLAFLHFGINVQGEVFRGPLEFVQNKLKCLQACVCVSEVVTDANQMTHLFEAM